MSEYESSRNSDRLTQIFPYQASSQLTFIYESTMKIAMVPLLYTQQSNENCVMVFVLNSYHDLLYIFNQCNTYFSDDLFLKLEYSQT